jgi:hypothetical protein
VSWCTRQRFREGSTSFFLEKVTHRQNDFPVHHWLCEVQGLWENKKKVHNSAKKLKGKDIGPDRLYADGIKKWQLRRKRMKAQSGWKETLSEKVHYASCWERGKVSFQIDNLLQKERCFVLPISYWCKGGGKPPWKTYIKKYTTKQVTHLMKIAQEDYDKGTQDESTSIIETSKSWPIYIVYAMCMVSLACAIDFYALKIHSTYNQFLSFGKKQNRTTCHLQIISQSIFIPRSKVSPKDSSDIELTHVNYALYKQCIYQYK